MRPWFIHRYPHFDFKLKRALHRATDANPKCLEAPYYAVYDLWINDLILDEKDYTCCPQGALSILVEGGRMKKGEMVKRYPDFIVYHDREGAVEGGMGDTQVAFIVEIKPWLATCDLSDHDAIKDHFNRPDFLIQVRDHAKMIMKKQGAGPVWLVQCVGMFWRYGKVQDNKNLSPFSKIRSKGKKPRDIPTFDVQWGPIQKVGEDTSDEEQYKFWQEMSDTVEYVLFVFFDFPSF